MYVIANVRTFCDSKAILYDISVRRTCRFMISACVVSYCIVVLCYFCYYLICSLILYVYRDTPLRLIKVVCMCQANHYLAFVIHRDCRYCNVWRHTPTCTDITGWVGHELRAALENRL